MSLAMPPERRMRGEPYRREHEASVEARMEVRATMPRTLEALVQWFIEGLSLELPDRLHRAELWHDEVTQGERESGIRPLGGSLIGSLAWSGGMRAILERSPSSSDAEGYYATPMRAALGRLSRKWPLVARNLAALAMREGDWHGLAAAKGWGDEEMEVYLAEALRRLWNQYEERTRLQ